MTETFAFTNVYKGYMYTRKGKRDKHCVKRFEEHSLEDTIRLSRTLKDKTYKVGNYYKFLVHEPKTRLIMAPPFRDRVMQRCLCEQILEEKIEKHLIFDTYACRKGKGTHAGLYRVEEFLKSYYRKNGRDGYIIKGDIAKYFYSIVHSILKEKLYPLLKEYDVEWLLDQVIDGTPCPGIPLGNQSSQWFANFYMSCFDHYVKEVLGVKYYLRYMDDFFAIVESKEKANEILNKMKEFLWNELKLETNAKTQIFPMKNGVDFLGFHTYITATGKVIRRIRRDSKERMKKKLRKFKKLYKEGKITKEAIDRSYSSWVAHAKHGSCRSLLIEMDKLYADIFKGDES